MLISCEMAKGYFVSILNILVGNSDYLVWKPEVVASDAGINVG